MRGTDDQLTVELDSYFAEVGGQFTGRISRAPIDGAMNTEGRGNVRQIKVVLRMFTEGRGDTDSTNGASVDIPVDEYGMASGTFALPVPFDAPISYDGSLIRVRWVVRVRSDRKMAIDDELDTNVVVVPAGGLGRYNNAHPIR